MTSKVEEYEKGGGWGKDPPGREKTSAEGSLKGNTANLLSAKTLTAVPQYRSTAVLPIYSKCTRTVYRVQCSLA